MSSFGYSNKSWTGLTSSSILSGSSSSIGGSLIVTGTSSNYWTTSVSTFGSIIGGGYLSHCGGNVNWKDERQEQIDSLKELVNLLLIINDIEIDIDEFIKMEKDERIITIRDIKIKKILK